MKKDGVVQKALSFLLPRLGEIFFLAVFAAVVGLGPELMNQDGDLGRHLTLGGYILESRTIPTEDLFSFTKYGDPLTPHEWLADVLFSLAYLAAGLDGVVWLTALIIAGASLLIYRCSLNLSKISLLSLILGIIGAAAASLHWLTRPHIFTILMTSIWVGEMENLRLGIQKRWWIFPVMMLIWVNLHGAFIAGLLIWGCYFAGEVLDKGLRWPEIRLFTLAGMSSFLVSILNPDGIGIWKTGFGFLGNRYLVSHTAEYLPPDFQNPAFWPFLLLISVSILILGIKKRRVFSSHLILIAGWTVMALYSARNIPLYVAAVIPFLAMEGSAVMLDYKENPWVRRFLRIQERISRTESDLKGGFWGTAIVLLVFFMLRAGSDLDFRGAGNQFLPEVFPVEAADWIEENEIKGNGFNYFPWGGYLLYRFWPERLVFIDGQTDFYGEELTRKYEEVITAGGDWEEILSDYGVAWVLVPAGGNLADELEAAPSWTLIYQDKTAMMFKVNHDQGMDQ